MRKPEKKCAGCGSCTVVCPVFRTTGNEALSARGKQRLLESALSENPSPVFKDIFAKCLLCGACESVCPRGLSLVSSVVEARSAFSGLYGEHGARKVLLDELLQHPLALSGILKIAGSLERFVSVPSWSGLHFKIPILQKNSDIEQSEELDSVPPVSGSKASVSLFTGCFARYLQPSVILSLNKLLTFQDGPEKGDIPVGQKCCGLATYSMGRMGRARKLAKENILAFEGSDNPILVGCASCHHHLKTYPDLLRREGKWYERALSFCNRLRSFEQFFTPLISSGVLRAPVHQRVIHHTSCHQRFHGDDLSFSHVIYQQIANTLYLGETKKCCGFGGLFQLGYPEISRAVFKRGYDAVKQKEPTVVLTSCTGCLIWWSMELARLGSSCVCLHPASFLASCLPDGDQGGLINRL